MLPKIIGLVGHIRAGKTTAATYLAKTYGYTLASNSAILRGIAHDLDMTANRENLKRLGDAVFKHLGNDAIARYRLQSLTTPIVVDGIRYLEEVDAYLSEPTFILIGMSAPNEIRHFRAMEAAHEGKDAALSLDDFDQLNHARSEEKVPELMANANYQIENIGGITELQNKIDSILNGK